MPVGGAVVTSSPSSVPFGVVVSSGDTPPVPVGFGVVIVTVSSLVPVVFGVVVVVPSGFVVVVVVPRLGPW